MHLQGVQKTLQRFNLNFRYLECFFFRHPVHEHTWTECHQADRTEDSECRLDDAEMFDDLDLVDGLEEVAQLV